MANGKKPVQNEKKGNSILTILLALVIVALWLAIFGLLIKKDVGGFGSGVLRPILKDVPIIRLILPDVPEEQIAKENGYAYSSLEDAAARVEELEQMVKELEELNSSNGELIAQLQTEVDRLKVFEENQTEFEDRQLEFDRNVVFSEDAPDIEEYRKYYEEINPANAETIYRQVIEQLQYSSVIQDRAAIYKNMDPEAAADVLETMTADIEAVAEILLCMKPTESAEIMSEMDSVVAAKITKKMLDMDAEKLKE